MSAHDPLIPSQPVIPPEESLIQYPCAFPIKVMGEHCEVFISEMVLIAQTHDPAFDPAQHLAQRPSSAGKYIGLTLTVTATSRDQLDSLYRALTGHPLVKYAL